jgi:hypothetical protein
MADDLWRTFEPIIVPLLSGDDDPALWAAVVNAIYPDAQALCRSVAGRRRVLTQLGRCSHWLRPHQTRWTADGGFAWPTGYDGLRLVMLCMKGSLCCDNGRQVHVTHLGQGCPC